MSSLGTRGILTRAVFQQTNRAICGDCRGKGFPDKLPTCGRAARKCQRCRGVGFVIHGKVRR